LGFGIEPDAPEFEQLRTDFLNYHAEHGCDHSHLFDGMAELVDELERRKLPWGIVTNKPHRFTVPLMQALGYADRAACLISGDTCARAKPFPDQLLKAANDICVAPEHCLYLGDDLRDMQAARAANMRGIIASYGYVSADASVENWQADGSIAAPMELLRFL
ncbi:MAG: HAD-IA family hydrolase, partial [Gallionellaceae bacterium]|nr:HAD-IA family hydrolase [Gallionellaceae bacterium]